MRRFCFICGATLLFSGSIALIAFLISAVAFIGPPGTDETGWRMGIAASFVAAIAMVVVLSLVGLAGAGLTWMWRRALQG